MTLDLGSLRSATASLDRALAVYQRAVSSASRSTDELETLRAGVIQNHTARNLTAHTYQVTVAERVLALATPFAHAARALLAALETRNA